MPEYLKIAGNIVISTGYVLLLATIFYSVKAYSNTVRLFENIELEISGNQYIYESTIKDQLYPYLNNSILSLDIRDVQKEIAAIDFVETVQVSRILPKTLVVQVVEILPLLLINFQDENFFMNRKGKILPADIRSISFFPVPIITITETEDTYFQITKNIADFFTYIVDEYPRFYDNLSEVLIQEGKWVFYSDSKTRIYAAPENLRTQFNILKNFERTVYPNRSLLDYAYIDLRIEDKVVVKEKYRKG